MKGTRAVTHRDKKFNSYKGTVTYNGTLNERGQLLLRLAQATWDAADGLDTAVRDEIAQGVALIVRAGYDCLASNMDIPVDAWMNFIDHSTAEWFRNRDFAEWFCIGAARGLNSSRPRNLSDVIVSRKPARQKRRAASKKESR
jgi:hypothetical protein